MPKKKIIETEGTNTNTTMSEVKIEEIVPTISPVGAGSTPEKIEVSNADLLFRLDEQAKTIKMLLEVADKGRVMNYENQRTTKKPMEVKLSLYGGGIIVGWRTAKDELVKNLTTGLTVGEQQEYELLILDHEDKIKKVTILGYPQFSNARYDTRVTGQVVGKKEDFDGKVTFDVKLEDGRVVSLASQFVN